MKKRFACRHRVVYVPPVRRPRSVTTVTDKPVKIGLLQFVLEIKAGNRTR